MIARVKVPIWIEPLDVLFFRDGRPFAAATRASSGLPTPQTLAGAVWTALLRRHDCDFRILAAEVRKGIAWPEAVRAAGAPDWIAEIQVRGPWLATSIDRKTVDDVYVPAPAVLQRSKNQTSSALHRLTPLPVATTLPGWQPPSAGLRPLWLRTRDAVEPARGYLNRAGLQTFLEGKAPSNDDVVSSNDLYAYEHRTGIGIQFDRLTAEHGQIYLASFLAMKTRIGFYAEIMVPESAVSSFPSLDTISFGGEGKRVSVHRLATAHAWPNVSPAGQRKPLWLLTTPAFFSKRWHPTGTTGLLSAAAVPGDLAVSGWDLARRGPKPTRFAAVAGSVYFLNSLPAPVPEVLSESPEDQQQGWGCFVQGVWTDE